MNDFSGIIIMFLTEYNLFMDKLKFNYVYYNER